VLSVYLKHLDVHITGITLIVTQKIIHYVKYSIVHLLLNVVNLRSLPVCLLQIFCVVGCLGLLPNPA
jgi:hypothetical protein